MENIEARGSSMGKSSKNDSRQTSHIIRGRHKMVIKRTHLKMNGIELVESKEDIKYNIKVIDKYLSDKVDPEYSFALNLIKRGICFVADDSSGQTRFYPSRFLGYATNSMDMHQNNDQKDGRVTNPAITEILGSKPEPNSELEKAYTEYCEYL